MSVGFVLRLVVLAGGALAAPESQGVRDEAYYANIRRSIDPIYRLDYDVAVERLSALTEEFPAHPGPPLSQAAAIWLRELFRRQELDLDRFIAPAYFTRPTDREMPAGERADFERLLGESRRRAESLLQASPGDLDARYYLGAAEGIAGAFALTIDRSKLAALRHGRSAYRYQKEIVDQDPDYADAYMTVGSYEYIVDNLPWYIKWIAVIAGYSGDRQRGFDYLIRAADKGRFVATDARVLLMLLYVREREFDYALALASELRGRYPQNFLFRLNEGQILEKMGRHDDALEVYADVERRAQSKEPNYQKLSLGSFRYRLAGKFLERDELDEALERFRSAARDSEIDELQKTLSHLEAGKLLDRLGKRAEAIEHYRIVRELPDVDGSREKASRYLDKPFAAGRSPE